MKQRLITADLTIVVLNALALDIQVTVIMELVKVGFSSQIITLIRLTHGLLTHNKLMQNQTLPTMYLRTLHWVMNALFTFATINQIEFINNKFTNILIQGTEIIDLDEFPAFVERKYSNFKLIYNHCFFSNISNEHSKSPSNQGGEIQFYTNFSVIV